MRTALFLLIGALAWLNLGAFQKQIQILRHSEDRVSSYERRLQELSAYLPETGPVGYLSDLAPEQDPNRTEFIDLYYRTQYGLAPRVLVPPGDADLIVASFTDPRSRERLAEGLELVKDFGGGLVLLRRKAR